MGIVRKGCGGASQEIETALRSRVVLYSGMDQSISVLERAFQLAKSGLYPTIGIIKKQLQKEGYWAAQIEGPVLHRQLAEMIRANSSKP